MKSIQLKIMFDEHKAWIQAGEALQALGYEDSWDDPKLAELYEKITAWGEEIARLRHFQITSKEEQ